MRSNEKYYSNLFSHNGAGVSLLCSAIVALFLSACGGGGGSGGGNDGAAPTGQVPPSVPDLDSNRELALPDLPAGWETGVLHMELKQPIYLSRGICSLSCQPCGRLVVA